MDWKKSSEKRAKDRYRCEKHRKILYEKERRRTADHMKPESLNELVSRADFLDTRLYTIYIITCAAGSSHDERGLHPPEGHTPAHCGRKRRAPPEKRTAAPVHDNPPFFTAHWCGDETLNGRTGPSVTSQFIRKIHVPSIFRRNICPASRPPEVNSTVFCYMSPISAIPVRTLSQEVARRIRAMILQGLIAKGEKIGETHLCQTLGISRTPLREALRLLSSEGLIDLIPNRGAYVAQPSMQDVKELFEVMAILEGACARVIAERMTRSDFVKIERLHGKLEKYFAVRDHERYLKVNHQFHALVQEMAGNRILNEVISGLRDKIQLYRYRQLYQPDRFQASISEHRDLLEALRRRDPAAAESLMKIHLMNQCEALKVLYEKRTGEDGSPVRETMSRDDPAT